MLFNQTTDFLPRSWKVVVVRFIAFFASITISLNLAWGLTAELAESVRVGRKLLDRTSDFAPYQIEKCFTPAIVT
ncbi:hypothetical protein MK131_15805, partial [Candidatus Poribacteria bacterium]|nr:hypothetical protein [Candidatus Poribacteria bacterium]